VSVPSRNRRERERRRRLHRRRARAAVGLVAVIVLALILAVPGHHGRARRAGARTAGGSRETIEFVRPAPLTPTSLYRWLIPTAGPQPSVARENRAPGSGAWRLRGPARDLGGVAQGPVEGYVAEQAVSPGQIERVYVSARRARAVHLRIFRMGWYHGSGGRLVLETGELAARGQHPCHHYGATGLTECHWHPTLSFRVPSALPSGVYIVKMTARGRGGGERDCLFVVRALRPTALMAVIPTASYEAYNAWGGDSLYPGGKLVGDTGTTQGVEVSYDRPYDSQTGAGQFFIREVAAVRFLERFRYPVSYTTTEAVDREPSETLSHRALLDVGHSEYWSARAAQAFATARDLGTSLIFLSSDTMAWRVRFARATSASSQAGESDHVIVAYKQFAALDPDRSHRSGLFPAGGAGLVGSAYDGCITARLPVIGPPIYRYFAWTPNPALQPRWLFARTGIRPTTSIPGIVGYELDQRTRATPQGTLLVGSGLSVGCRGVAEPSPVKGRLAETTLYRARSGALVFATGTMGWLYALSPVPQASPDAPRRPDRRVLAMTRNLLARVLARKRPARSRIAGLRIERARA
jgi:hypothetical protein